MYSPDYDLETKLAVQSVVKSKVENPGGWLGDLEAEGLDPQRIEYLLSIIGMNSNSPDEKWDYVIAQYNNQIMNRGD